MLADMASSVAQTLQLYKTQDGTYYNYVAPGTPLSAFCFANGASYQPYGLVQCVLFVRFCLLHAGYPAPAFGNGKDAGQLVQTAGYLDVTYSVPAPGDVVCWGPPGSDLGPGQNPDLVNGAGHVALITAVTLPDASGAGGSVTVAQANCTERTQAFPLAAFGQGYQIGSNTGFGPWLGIVRPRHGATPQ